MLNPSEFVKETRTAFKGKWADSFIASILSSIFASILFSYYTVIFCIVLLPFTLINIREDEYTAYRHLIHFFSNFKLHYLGFHELLIFIFFLFLICIYCIISNQFNLIKIKNNLDLVKGENNTISELTKKFKSLLNPSSLFYFFSSKKHLYKALIPTFTGILYMFLFLIGSMLIVIPGVIIAFGLALVPFLQVDNPNAKPIALIMKSWALMIDKKSQIFMVYLYCIPLILIATITCGIGYIWVVPFLNFLMARYYLSLEVDKAISEVDCVIIENESSEVLPFWKEQNNQKLINFGLTVIPLMAFLIMPIYISISLAIISLILMKIKSPKLFIFNYLPIFSLLSILVLIVGRPIGFYFSMYSLFDSDQDYYFILFNIILTNCLIIYNLCVYFNGLNIIFGKNTSEKDVLINHNLFKYFRYLISIMAILSITFGVIGKLQNTKSMKEEITKSENTNQSEEINSPEIIENSVSNNDVNTIESQVKSINDLINYGEFVSNSNGAKENLYFTNIANGELLIEYTSNNGKRKKLGLKKQNGTNEIEGIYFMSNPNEIYKITEIEQNNTKFKLISPDGTCQEFMAIEH